MAQEHVAVAPERHARGDGGDDDAARSQNGTNASQNFFRFIQMLEDICEDHHIEFFGDRDAFHMENISEDERGACRPLAAMQQGLRIPIHACDEGRGERAFKRHQEAAVAAPDIQDPQIILRSVPFDQRSDQPAFHDRPEVPVFRGIQRVQRIQGKMQIEARCVSAQEDAVLTQKRIAIDIGVHVKDDNNVMSQIKTAQAALSAAVTVVVPCFNEEERLQADAFVTFSKRFPSIRFLFVDDGSTDGTRHILQRLCDEQSHSFALLVLPNNNGKAEAVRQGLLHALQSHPPYVAFWDADLATPLEELLSLLRLAEDHRDARMVVGSRVRLLGRSIERSMVRHYAGRIFATMASLILSLPLYDTQCGAKLLRVTPTLPTLLGRPFLSRWIFDVELFARIAADASREHLDPQTCIIEYPLQTWREQGNTKMHFVDFIRIPWDLLRISFVTRGRRPGMEPSTPDARVAAQNE